MILESVVIFSCYKGFCEQALDSYYVQNPLFKDRVYEIKKDVEEFVDPYMDNTIIRYTLPIAMFAKDKKASIDLGNKKTLTVESGDYFSLKIIINF